MKNKVSILFAVIALVLATLACSLAEIAEDEMSLENLRTAYDSDGENLTTVFSPADVFFAVADLNYAPAGTVVEAKWLAVQVEGYDSGELIYEQAITDFTEESFSGTIYFQLSNDAGWTVGEYKVDIYLNGTFIQSANFSVR